MKKAIAPVLMMVNHGHKLKSYFARCVYLLTGSRSGQQEDGEGQAQAGDMSRYHRRPPQPHVQPEFPHPQPLSHRTVLHIRPHAAEPPARLPARSSASTRCTESKIPGACGVKTLHELHNDTAVRRKTRAATGHTAHP